MRLACLSPCASPILSWLLACVMLLTLCAATPVPPRFEDFPAEAAWHGKHVPVVLSQKDRLYRTRLRAAGEGPVNFAGHYSLGEWGCGFECRVGAIIDLNTGHVIWLPGSVCCFRTAPGSENLKDDFDPIEYRKDSRLLRLTGIVNEEGDFLAHYYALRGGRLVHLVDVPLLHRNHPKPANH